MTWQGHSEISWGARISVVKCEPNSCDGLNTEKRKINKTRFLHSRSPESSRGERQEAHYMLWTLRNRKEWSILPNWVRKVLSFNSWEGNQQTKKKKKVVGKIERVSQAERQDLVIGWCQYHGSMKHSLCLSPSIYR